MRITQTMLTQSVGRSLSSLKERVARAQEQIASGEVATRASDDPYRATATMEWYAVQRRLERAEAAATEASDWLAAAEVGLNRMIGALQKSRELSVTARSTLTGEAREAVAQEIQHMGKEVLTAANTQHRGTYLFAGHQVHTEPFTVTEDGGGEYRGDFGNPEVEVLPGVRMGIRVPGDRLLGGGDFVGALKNLAGAVRAGDDGAIGTYQEELDAILDRVVNERSDVGVRMRTLEEYTQATRETWVQVTGLLATATGTDLTRVAMELAQEEVTYRAALAAASRLLPPSLMEMLD